MQCTYAVPFDISKSPVKALEPPPNWGSDDCMANAAFGSFAGAPVAYTDGTNAGPELTDRVTALGLDQGRVWRVLPCLFPLRRKL